MNVTMGWPYPKRKSHLDALVATPSDRTEGVTFQGRYQHLRVYTVPISLAKYRLANGRTLAAQAEYLSTHKELPGDFFTRDLESDEAQAVQHQLLKQMLPGAGLFAYFKKHKQTQPLVLTNQGFVVNGNRRLCAMRELLLEAKSTYQHFENVDVVVLPPATEQELDEVEAQFQIHPDIRDEYTWYAKAMMLKRRRNEHKLTWEDLSRKYEMREGQIKELIRLLEDAEAYLADRNKTGQYHLLDEKEYAFRQLRNSRHDEKLFKSEEQKLAFEKLSYCLLDDDATQGRLYEAIPSVARHFAKVVDTLRQEMDLAKAPDLSDILDLTDKEEKRSQVREIVASVVAVEKLKEKELKKKDFVLDQIRKANTALLDAFHAISPSTSKNGISAQLDAIQESLKKLSGWLNGKDKR